MKEELFKRGPGTVARLYPRKGDALTLDLSPYRQKRLKRFGFDALIEYHGGTKIVLDNTTVAQGRTILAKAWDRKRPDTQTPKELIKKLRKKMVIERQNMEALQARADSLASAVRATNSRFEFLQEQLESLIT